MVYLRPVQSLLQQTKSQQKSRQERHRLSHLMDMSLFLLKPKLFNQDLDPPRKPRINLPSYHRRFQVHHPLMPACRTRTPRPPPMRAREWLKHRFLKQREALGLPSFFHHHLQCWDLLVHPHELLSHHRRILCLLCLHLILSTNQETMLNALFHTMNHNRISALHFQLTGRNLSQAIIRQTGLSRHHTLHRLPPIMAGT